MLFDGSQHRHAELAALQWGGSDLEHLQTSGNAVYRMTRRGEPVILRLGHPRHRSAEHDRAEVEFVAHLERCAVPVAAPIAADDGRLVLASGEYSATAFRWAPGRCVGPRDPEWGEPLVREWGRVLGMIHRAALTHEPPGAPRRWHWADEYLWREASELIPRDDIASHRELESVVAFASSSFLEMPASFGMIHADFAPQNFHVDGTRLTAFDFGNCCYHHLAADVAISLSTIRGRKDRDHVRAWLLDGYADAMPITFDDEQLDWLIRLRVVYVYLTRLKAFGESPSAEQREILDGMRTAVHRERGW